MLTIGQLAATAGVTVRTVRHYHHVGLLPEPGRDASGYRRYSAQAAVDLIRIRTLADVGVPLARVDALLHARPEEFAAAITDIDAELRRKIDRLTENRLRIADLTGGERLVLPPEVVALLDRMRGLGISERRGSTSPVIRPSAGTRATRAWTGSSTTWTPGRSGTNRTVAGPGTASWSFPGSRRRHRRGNASSTSSLTARGRESAGE
ncbi:MerR family transcriptional regulator [Amycolatopsis alba]|uniref:MerR family transcriptional regulator n=1 Tax=Amycolatopsis alba TaxID=76020 RepID=UPI00039C812C|nr:MerR family transcriptional regulator [Amycolatopsis alba]